MLAGCEVRCPSCSHRDWDAEKSEENKRSFLEKTLDYPVEKTRALSEAARLGYREKTCLHAEWKSEGRWALGLLARSQSEIWAQELVEIPHCPVHSVRVRDWVSYFSSHLPARDDFPLVYLVISGRIVTLVVKSSRLPDFEKILQCLDPSELTRLGVVGLYLNLNPSAGNRVFSSRGWHLIWGERLARSEFGFHGPEAFQQLIPSLYRDAIREAAEFLQPGSSDAVADLYSGAGFTLGVWARSGAKSVGVELQGEAIECASLNLGRNAEELCLRGRVSERIPQLDAWLEAFDRNRGRFLVFANPPRLGLETEVARWLAERARPVRIAYLSCSPGTLARDLSVLTEAGYCVRKIIPYDFFPQTRHVEALALLDLDSGAALSRSSGSGSKLGSFG